MLDLARRGVKPSVVADQYGRLTFTADLAAGIVHLLTTRAPFGTYNLTNSGPPRSFYEIAQDVFGLCGRERSAVSPIDTASYNAGKVVSPRPMRSTLDIAKIIATGFSPADADQRLAAYVASLR